jgi:hypothetical protein
MAHRPKVRDDHTFGRFLGERQKHLDKLEQSFYYFLTMVTQELDLLPQDIHWRDEGCDLFPSCLNCPRSRCIEEEPRGKQRLRSQARAERMAALKGEGRSVTAIAEMFGVSTRTVQRALAMGKSKVKSQKLK